MSYRSHFRHWLIVADALDELHCIIYGPHAESLRARPGFHHLPSLLQAAEKIRTRCSNGLWFAWGDEWMAGETMDALRALSRFIAANRDWQSDPAHRTTLDQIRRLQGRIADHASIQLARHDPPAEGRSRPLE